MKTVTASRLPLFALAVLFCCVAFSRNSAWRDNVSLWRDAVTNAPGKARPNYELGLAYAKANDANAAFWYMKRAREQSPTLFNDAAVSPAEGLRRLGRLDEAIAEYRKMLAQDPAQPVVHNILGTIYHAQGRDSDAAAEFQAAIRLNPGFAEAHSNLGYAYAAMGYLDGALVEYRQAVALAPADPEPHAKLGYAYAKLGKRREAIAELRAALELDPGHAGARQALDWLEKGPGK